MTDRSMLRRVTREEAQALLADCQRYIAATGMAPSSFGYRACKRGSLISDLRIGRRPTRQTVDRVRAFMRGAPEQQKALNAVAGRQAKDDEALALAERRIATLKAREAHVLRCQQSEARTIERRRLGAAIQERMVDGPGDAIRVVQARWPDLWSRVVEAARTQGALPGAVMVEAIERGLAA